MTSLRIVPLAMRACDLVPGAEIEPVIERMLADPAVQELHVHNARAGCFNCRIVRGLGE